MSEIVYELVCDACGADYQINYIDGIVNHNEPMYCPFCGADIDLTDVEEESEVEDTEFFDELDFEDD